MFRHYSTLFTSIFTCLLTFSNLAQDVSSAIIIANGSTFERMEREYIIDNSTIIWHALMDGNRLTAVLFTKNESNKWDSKKLELSHYDVYGTKWAGYAKIDGNIVRFRIDKNKKIGYEYFMDKLVGANFEKAATPFRTEPIEGEIPMIEEVLITDRINLVMVNSTSEGSIATKKVKSFNSKTLEFISMEEFDLPNSGKVNSTKAISVNDGLGFIYFNDKGDLNVTLIQNEESNTFTHEREKVNGIMHLDYQRISTGNFQIAILEDQLNPTSILLELNESRAGELTVLDQKQITWDETFRDYPNKLNTGNGTLLSGMKRRNYELTNVLEDGDSKYMVYVIAVPIIGVSQSGPGEFSRSVWGVDNADLMIVKCTKNKVEWMQSVRRAHREVNSKENSHLPIVTLEGNELKIINRESSQFFDAGGNYISGLEQGRVPKLVNSKVVIDGSTGEILSNKIAE